MSDSVSGSAGLGDLGRSGQEPAVLGDVQRSRALSQVDGRSVVHCRSRSNAHSDFAALQGAVAHRHNTPGCGLSLQLRNLDGQTFTLGVVGLAVANGESLAEVALSIAITDDEVLRQLMVLVDSLHSLAQLVAGQSTSGLEVPLAIDVDDVALTGSVDMLISQGLVDSRLLPA